MTRSRFWIAAALSTVAVMTTQLAAQQSGSTNQNTEQSAAESDAANPNDPTVAPQDAANQQPNPQQPQPADPNQARPAEYGAPPQSSTVPQQQPQQSPQPRQQPQQQLSQPQQPQQQQSFYRGAPNQTDATHRHQTNVDVNVDAQSRGIRFGQPTSQGLTINTVEQNSIFFRSGIRQNDILVSVDGRPVRSDADFFAAIRPGLRVPVVVVRDGRRETIFIESTPTQQTYGRAPQTMPYDRSFAGGRPYLGVVFDTGARGAAIVRSVVPASPAEEAGIQAGDAIVAINGEPVRSGQDAISIVGTMQAGDRIAISFERRMQSETEAVLAGQPGRTPRTAAGEFDRGVEQSSASVLVEEDRAFDDRRDVNIDRDADVEVDVDRDIRDRRDIDNRGPDDTRGGILNRNRNNNQRRGLFN